jgi:hypothetical protein
METLNTINIVTCLKTHANLTLPELFIKDILTCTFIVWRWDFSHRNNFVWGPYFKLEYHD